MIEAIILGLLAVGGALFLKFKELTETKKELAEVKQEIKIKGIADESKKIVENKSNDNLVDDINKRYRDDK